MTNEKMIYGKSDLSFVIDDFPFFILRSGACASLPDPELFRLS
jgi:hypothetical protein